MVSFVVSVPRKKMKTILWVPKSVLFPLQFLRIEINPLFFLIFLQNKFIMVVLLLSSSEVGTSIKQANHYNINV